MALLLALLGCGREPPPQPSALSEPPFLPSNVQGESWCRVEYGPDGHASGRTCCEVEWVTFDQLTADRLFSGTWQTTKDRAGVELYPQCKATS